MNTLEFKDWMMNKDPTYDPDFDTGEDEEYLTDTEICEIAEKYLDKDELYIPHNDDDLVESFARECIKTYIENEGTFEEGYSNGWEDCKNGKDLRVNKS